jgi:hypothetical protein
MIDLPELKNRWTEVLDTLERANRIAWLAYFDGRLSELSEGRLTLDFRDAAKLAGDHDYTYVRKAEHRKALEAAIKEVTGERIEVVEI